MEYPLRDGKGTKAKSFKEFSFSDGTKIGVFQGNRGNNPDFDMRVMFQQPTTVARTPQHLHWAIDLLIKEQYNKELTKEFIKYLLEMWHKVQPFRTKEEQQKCELKYSNKEHLKPFLELDKHGEYKIEFIATLLELIMIQEKTGSSKAHMFREVLESILNDKDIFSIVSKAGYGGKKG